MDTVTLIRALGKWVFHISLDKRGIKLNIFLIYPYKHILWVLIRSAHQGTSNEYPQHMFFYREIRKKKNNILEPKTELYLEL